MIQINIPGSESINTGSLVCDYNGTLATDGTLIPGVYDLLKSLEKEIEIYLITSDTFGKAREYIKDNNCQLIKLRKGDEQLQKAELIEKLGAESVIAIGNGSNDALMLKNAALGIVVVQKEGAATETLLNSDIICTNIIDPLDLLVNPLRITATLRK